MQKIFGLTLALVLAMSLSATAAEKLGTVKSVDRANQSFTLEDGTQLSVSEGALSDLAPGQKVRAAYEMKNGKNVVIELNRVATGPDGAPTDAIDRLSLNHVESPGD